MRTCRWAGCARSVIPTGANGIAHAHCDAHERRLLSEAFGAIGWHDRARNHTLPAPVTGGTHVTTARSAAEPGSSTPLALPVPAAERAAVAAPTG